MLKIILTLIYCVLTARGIDAIPNSVSNCCFFMYGYAKYLKQKATGSKHFFTGITECYKVKTFSLRYIISKVKSPAIFHILKRVYISETALRDNSIAKLYHLNGQNQVHRSPRLLSSSEHNTSRYLCFLYHPDTATDSWFKTKIVYLFHLNRSWY